MIQLLFLVLVAFSCFEGSDSENKCGNVEQKTVKPTTINCPNKSKITKPIWKPVSPQYLRSALLNDDDDPSCPPNPTTNENSPVLEQKKKPTLTPCMGSNDRREETEQKKLNSSGVCYLIPKVQPECPTSPVLHEILPTVEQMKQPLAPVICDCHTTPHEIEEKKVETPKTNDSGKNNSEKPPVKEKQGCSGSDDKKTEKKKTDSTHFRRPSPERPYLDI